MQNVILILLSLLIVIVIGMVYFGYKKISDHQQKLSKMQLDIVALRNFIDERVLNNDSVNINYGGVTGGYSQQNSFNNELDNNSSVNDEDNEDNDEDSEDLSANNFSMSISLAQTTGQCSCRGAAAAATQRSQLPWLVRTSTETHTLTAA